MPWEAIKDEKKKEEKDKESFRNFLLVPPSPPTPKTKPVFSRKVLVMNKCLNFDNFGTLRPLYVCSK